MMNMLLTSFFLGVGLLVHLVCLGDMEPSKEEKRPAGEAEVAQGNELNIVQTFKGAFSGVTQAKNVVINKKEDWENLWKEVHSLTLPPPPVPDIDFSKYTVLATFSGQKPTGGYGVSIPKVVKKDKEILVFVENKEPSRDAMIIQAITAPYCMVVVPKIEDEKIVQWQMTPKAEGGKP